MTITTIDRQTIRTGSHAHQVYVTDHTDIYANGKRVDCITWGSALLRRLERKNETREEYVARIASRYKENA